MQFKPMEENMKNGSKGLSRNWMIFLCLFTGFAVAFGVAFLIGYLDVFIVVCAIAGTISFFVGMGSMRLSGDADFKQGKCDFRSTFGAWAMTGGALVTVAIVIGCFLQLDVERDRILAEQVEKKKIETYFADTHDHICREMTPDEAIAEFWR